MLKKSAGWFQVEAAAHLEHVPHVRDPGGVPVGKVLIEIVEVVVVPIIVTAIVRREELAHVGDG